jgi:hypothetical protein
MAPRVRQPLPGSRPARKEVAMFDHFSSQLSELRRESHRGAVGRQDYDREVYGLLLGEAEPSEPPKRRIARRAALIAVPIAAVASVAIAVVWALGQPPL